MLEILWVFLRLGLTSFGGPIAHLGYFHQEFVVRRNWVNSQQFNGWLAVCQALPGPASSQLGFLIGMHRGGVIGALAAWIGFTLPSALILVLLAIYGLRVHELWLDTLVHGLKLVAVAVVAQAVYSMFSNLCRQWQTRLLGLLGLAVSLWFSGWTGQLLAIGVGAIAGLLTLKHQGPLREAPASLTLAHSPSKSAGLIILTIFGLLLLLLPWLASGVPELRLFDAFYRAGALVFGGGHVVLPLLESATVTSGMVSSGDFLAGYGLTQAVPGPLFTFAAWLGALDPALAGWLGAVVALIAIFLPGLLLVVGILPWWQWISHRSEAMAVFAGINAAVVGVLAAAWVDPIVATSIKSPVDALLALLTTGLLVRKKAPVWLMVILAPALSLVAHWLGLSN